MLAEPLVRGLVVPGEFFGKKRISAKFAQQAEERRAVMRGAFIARADDQKRDARAERKQESPPSGKLLNNTA